MVVHGGGVRIGVVVFAAELEVKGRGVVVGVDERWIYRGRR